MNILFLVIVAHNSWSHVFALGCTTATRDHPVTGLIRSIRQNGDDPTKHQQIIEHAKSVDMTSQKLVELYGNLRTEDQAHQDRQPADAIARLKPESVSF